MSQSLLFTPLALRSVTFKNRIFVSPMCQYSCGTDGVPTVWHDIHLGSRAVGGAALVMVESTAVSPEGRISPTDAGLWSNAQTSAMARLAALCKKLGAVPGVQIAHAGRKACTRPPSQGRGPVPQGEGGWPTVAPSALAFDEAYPTPRVLSPQDIGAIVMRFAEAAERARDAGFEVLELHFAHGYLMHQFLAPESNRRDDTYGGSLANRARAPLAVVEAVRRVWPDHLPLFVRLSVTSWLDRERDVAEAIEVSRWLRERGVDLIDCSSGGLVPHAHIPVGPGYQVPLAEAVRRGADIPVAAVGVITEPVQAEHIVRTGQADAVCIARASLRDPYWPLHAAGALHANVAWPEQYKLAVV
jgi:2,4-dienoyl-CoA reductase-like NADH-dependent reductase (Old Yellow Enzyme family)